MKTKKIQLAHLYNGDRFMGYGLAVDGLLLEKQTNSSIHTQPGRPPVIETHFHMSTEMACESPLRIQVGSVVE